MRNIFFAAILFFAIACAAAEDPVVEMYKDVLLKLEFNPGHPTILMTARPPVDMKNPTHRKYVDELVTRTSAKAAAAPNDFYVMHNAYMALWNRYLQYRDVQDAAAAFERLNQTADLAEGADQRSQCAFERAEDMLALTPEHALEIVGDDVENKAVEKYLDAKRKAMTEGYYAAKSALAVGRIYCQNGRLDEAQTLLREAMELDTEVDGEKGYVTNHAYHYLGLILLKRGNVEGAATMLEVSGNVKADEDIMQYGFAHVLALELVNGGHFTAPVEYLEDVMNLSDEGTGQKTIGQVYTLALAYTKKGDSGPALLYWDKYLSMGDENEARRKEAKKIAHELAIKTTKIKQ